MDTNESLINTPHEQQAKMLKKDENEEKTCDPCDLHGIEHEYDAKRRYWRIGNKFYDLEPWLDRHPGGRKILELSRLFFEDSTFAFESHHHDWKRARLMLRQYEVDKDKVPLSERNSKNFGSFPDLCSESTFYSVLRTRVGKYLHEVGGPGPTPQCLLLFFTVLVGWLTAYFVMWCTGSILVCPIVGILGSWLGAFGHNWIHQPDFRFYALLSLDIVGLSSEQWFREHVLQHHMYTNTTRDNHFDGTEPFLTADPRRPRKNFMKSFFWPAATPLVCWFGILGNHLIHWALSIKQLVMGQHVEMSIGKVFLPLQCYFLVTRWDSHGFLLLFTYVGTSSMYYFVIALMNHNTEGAWQVKQLKTAKDWGHAQLLVSSDINVYTPFLNSIVYLWLNYHTVHHLFPHVDMSHHPAIQKILIETCEEFNIHYDYLGVWDAYKQIVQSFSSPRFLNEEILPFYFTGS